MAVIHGKTVAIVGGGLGGLSAAYFLRKAHPKLSIHLLEAGSRTGGWIESLKHPGGATFEYGPRSVRANVGNAKFLLQIVHDLGLRPRLLEADMKDLTRYLYTDQHGLCALAPLAKSAQPPFTQPLWLPVVQHLLTMPQDKVKPDCSVFEFFQNRLGDEVATLLIDPLVRGIFAGDARQLSMRAAFPSMVELEKDSRNFLLASLRSPVRQWVTNVLRRKKEVPPDAHVAPEVSALEKVSIWGLRGGMQTLVDALRDYLIGVGVQMHMNSPVTCVTKFSVGGVHLTYRGPSSSTDLVVDHAFLATPLNTLPDLLGPLKEKQVLSKEGQDALETLSATPYATVAVVGLEYPERVAMESAGFGHLIPSTRTSQPHVLGVVYDSCIFPQLDGHSRSRFTVMMGGAWFDSHCASLSTDQLREVAQETVRTQCRFKAPLQDPLHVEVRLQRRCIPQYSLGHVKRVEVIRSQLSKLGLSLVGSGFDGVSVNDVAHSGYKAALGWRPADKT